MAIYSAAGFGGQALPIVELSGTTQQVAYNAAGGASVQSAAFGAKTEAIMISVRSTDADLRIKFGANPTASSTTDLLVKGGVYFFAVTSGQKIAFLSDSATTGTVTFTELLGLG
jgi:hypothetical protein